MCRLHDMEIFVRVVETGSFSATARDLKIGQLAIYKTVAGLEERIERTSFGPIDSPLVSNVGRHNFL